jgi:hypothetical protein
MVASDSDLDLLGAPIDRVGFRARLVAHGIAPAIPSTLRPETTPHIVMLSRHGRNERILTINCKRHMSTGFELFLGVQRQFDHAFEQLVGR